ncbi:hypothetical protein niasHT_030396 [Heterodera trifolii]|uniref:Chromo domain-containing protein n=1 Tax=Heterodera trifolii TaxID=157864 RepID=A0ABD2KT46_9BILA
MHVDFDPLAVDWSHFAEPPPRMDTMLMSGGGSSMGGGGGGGAAPSYPVFTGLPYQRGAGGIGSMFRSFLRFLVPIGRQAGAAIGRQGLETGSRVLSQMLEGRNVKEAMTEEGRAGLKNLLDKAADNLSRQRSAAAAAATNHGGAGRSGRGGGGGLFDFKRYRKIVSNNNNNNNHKRKSSSSSTNNIKRNKKRRTSILQSTVGPSLSTPAAAIAAKTKGVRFDALVKNELSKKISEQSALAFNSALNVFAVPPTNVSVSRSFFRELLPLSTISQEEPYLFRMFNDNLWADMSRVYLFLELSIQKEDAGGRWVPIEAADQLVGPVQCIGQTFVQQLKVTHTHIQHPNTLHLQKMVEVQPSLNLSIYKTLEKQPATYAVRKTEVKFVFLTAGRTEMDHNIFSAAIPRRLTIALVANGAFNGQLAQSPFNFKPYSTDGQFLCGHAYLLVCADTLSRQLFVEPLKSKRSSDIVQAFEKIFRRVGYVPWKLMTDQGKELTAAPVQRFLADQEVQHHCMHTSPQWHAGIAERAIRSIKEELFTVAEVRTSRLPITYKLRDDDGELLTGWFYAQDLCLVLTPPPPLRSKRDEPIADKAGAADSATVGPVYDIERVLRRWRGRDGAEHCFVKWKGYSAAHNS